MGLGSLNTQYKSKKSFLTYVMNNHKQITELAKFTVRYKGHLFCKNYEDCLDLYLKLFPILGHLT